MKNNKVLSNGNILLSKGSGVFLNKSGAGYLSTDKPYLLSAGHLFSSRDETGWLTLLHNHPDTRIEVYADYQNTRCNNTDANYKGNLLFEGTINDVKKIDQNFWFDPNWPGFYDPTHDYVLLQSPKNLRSLIKSGINFAGWEKYNLEFLRKYLQ